MIKFPFFFKKVPDFSGGLIAPLSSYRNNPYQKQPIFNYVLILILKLLFIYKYLFHNFTIFEKKAKHTTSSAFLHDIHIRIRNMLYFRYSI
ncbi:hypothetical protein BJI49_10500 [Acetobacter pasteurianus]|nr:hypothetical protein BJI49_10500 [Acetobacter pasteurianus]